MPSLQLIPELSNANIIDIMLVPCPFCCCVFTLYRAVLQTSAAHAHDQ